MKVLILSVNPRDTPNLRLDEEVQEIKEELAGSQIEIIVETAVQAEDLSLWLVRHDPEIVHFSGHGAGKYGLAFEDKNGRQQLVSTEALARLFKMLTTNIKLVVLNACYSKEQAKEISQHIDSVVGMNQEIGDNAAIQYAKGFYRALAANKSIEFAHGFGIVQIQAMSIPGHLIPELLTKGEYIPNIPAPTLQGKRSRIFISYKRDTQPDEAVALEVYQALKDRYDVFLEQRAVAGTRWAPPFEDALKQADFLISFISSESASAEVIQNTIEKVYGWRSETQKPALLPVRLAYQELLPGSLAACLDEKNFVHWKTPSDTSNLIDCLAQKIQNSVGLLPEIVNSDSLQIERKEDLYVLKQIENQDRPIAIAAPHQFGKTSLLNRLEAKLLQSRKLVARLDSQEFSQAALADAEIFFREFCSLLTEKLGLDDRVAEYWTRPYCTQNCTYYLEKFVLKELESPVVLMIDDIDILSATDFCADFFGMLRLWHNRRATNSTWRQLDLIVATSTEHNELEKSIQRSPFFNVAEVIELPDLTEQEVAELNDRYGMPLSSAQARQLCKLLKGHPALTRQALDCVKEDVFTPMQLFDSAVSQHGAFSRHLQRYHNKVAGEAELKEGMCQVLKEKVCRNHQAFSRLWRWGLVRRGEGHSVYPRCQLYAMYFERCLIGMEAGS